MVFFRKKKPIKNHKGFESIILNGSYLEIAVWSNGEWAIDSNIEFESQKLGNPIIHFFKASLDSFLYNSWKTAKYKNYHAKADRLVNVFYAMIKSLE